MKYGHHLGKNEHHDFIDKYVAMIATSDAWVAKRKKRDIYNAELKRKIPSGWTESKTGSER
jgi:hypothetical protein